MPRYFDDDHLRRLRNDIPLATLLELLEWPTSSATGKSPSSALAVKLTCRPSTPAPTSAAAFTARQTSIRSTSSSPPKIATSSKRSITSRSSCLPIPERLRQPDQPIALTHNTDARSGHPCCLALMPYLMPPHSWRTVKPGVLRSDSLRRSNVRFFGPMEAWISSEARAPYRMP